MAKRKYKRIEEPGVAAVWNIMSGTPCIVGTRLPTEMIMVMFARGDSLTNIAASYSLSRRMIESAVRYELRLKLAGHRRPRAIKPRAVGVEEGE